MLLFGLVHLGTTAIYSWVAMWSLGYHGVFILLLTGLWEVLYGAVWDLRYLWEGDGYYGVEVANWVTLGNFIFIDFSFIGDYLSLVLLLIMALGSFVVLSFVYVEMWEDKEGANFAVQLVMFLMFMTVLVGAGNLFIFYLG